MGLRVLVAHNRYRSALPSGENAVVDGEVARLRAAGVRVDALMPSSGAMSWRQRALLPVSPIWSPAAHRSFTGIDVLHLHNPYPLISPWIVRTARAAGVPVVQTVHNYRHECVSGLYFRDGSPCRDCRGRTVALPAVWHGCYRGSRAQSVVMAAALAVHRPTWRLVDRYLAPNQMIAAHLAGLGIPESRIVIKPNAVNDPGPPADEPGDGVLFAGRLSREKGLELLVAACERAGVRLRVGGDGPLRAIAPEWLGQLTPAGVRAAIRSSALVAVPSLLDDVQPTIAIEALANGRPVIGTPFGGIPEVIGGAGWVVPPTVDAWASALRTAERHDLSSAARARYLAKFHPDAATQALIAVYRELADFRRDHAGGGRHGRRRPS